MLPSDMILRFVGTPAFIAARDRRVAGLRSDIGLSSVPRWGDACTSTCLLLETVDGGHGAQISRGLVFLWNQPLRLPNGAKPAGIVHH